MKRIVIIENGMMPCQESEVVADYIYEDQYENGSHDIIKEINYADMNQYQVNTTLETYSNLTTKNDEFIVIITSTFNNITQVENTMKVIQDLKVKPKFYIVNGKRHVNKLIDSGLISVRLASKILDLIQGGLVYDFRIDNFDTEVESVTKLTTENYGY